MTVRTRPAFGRERRVEVVMKRTTALALALVMALSACESMNTSEKWGTTLGALAGGIIGYQFGGGWGQVGATAAGAALGGYGGYMAGGEVSK
ncbi:MAG: hypothetical protein A2516_11210 [Alphaproteobacteria bacterium RIFOXYD12_FULL_60_8]|nr:MAG: hypothetical protein A2516_11210 [Alphaproteobacteria bacterium RIFOXYD12_FULL_60_8]